MVLLVEEVIRSVGLEPDNLTVRRGFSPSFFRCRFGAHLIVVRRGAGRHAALHEVGHYVAHLSFLPQVFLRPTNRRALWSWLLDRLLPRAPLGFISHYARVSGEEDFCECFAVLAAHQFDPACVPTRDALVRQKLEAVARVVRSCRRRSARCK